MERHKKMLAFGLLEVFSVFIVILFSNVFKLDLSHIFMVALLWYLSGSATTLLGLSAFRS